MLLMSYGADLNAKTNVGQMPIDVARNEEIEQVIRDEPRRRMDHGHKRATEQDRHPNIVAMGQQGEKVEGGVVEGKVAEDDEDSEPSDKEEEEE